MEANTAADLCVLRDDRGTGWAVYACQGPQCRIVLGRFADRDEAAAFALVRRDQLVAEGQSPPRIHFPDDCPCIAPPGEASR
jgi:hypothetical protein